MYDVLKEMMRLTNPINPGANAGYVANGYPPYANYPYQSYPFQSPPYQSQPTPGYGGYAGGYGWGPPSPFTILPMITPIVEHGLLEAKEEKPPLAHLLREVGAISYLVALGYAPGQAIKIVESWEIGEKFPL